MYKEFLRTSGLIFALVVCGLIVMGEEGSSLEFKNDEDKTIPMAFRVTSRAFNNGKQAMIANVYDVKAKGSTVHPFSEKDVKSQLSFFMTNNEIQNEQTEYSVIFEAFTTTHGDLSPRPKPLVKKVLGFNNLLSTLEDASVRLKDNVLSIN